MKQYKIIAMDFDGTLLTSDKKVTENTKNILEECRNNNYIVIGITARNLASTKNVLDVNMFDYVLLNNGAFVLDAKSNSISSFGTLSDNDLRKIEEIFKDTDARCEYVSLNKYFIKGANDPKGIRVNINSTDDIDEEIARMNVYLNTVEQQAHYKKVITDSIDTVNVVAMKDTDNKNTWLWLTINEKETNKLSTLSKIIEKMSISLDEVIFFGDAENDLLILENVGMGVAMGNAIDEVKHKAKAITSTNDEEGIYEYLNKNLILRK